MCISNILEKQIARSLFIQIILINIMMHLSLTLLYDHPVFRSITSDYLSVVHQKCILARKYQSHIHTFHTTHTHIYVHFPHSKHTLSNRLIICLLTICSYQPYVCDDDMCSLWSSRDDNDNRQNTTQHSAWCQQLRCSRSHCLSLSLFDLFHIDKFCIKWWTNNWNRLVGCFSSKLLSKGSFQFVVCHCTSINAILSVEQCPNKHIT